MPLFTHDNISRYTEDEMQGRVAELLAAHFNVLCVREFRVPECGRISDIALIHNPRRIINVECKLTNIGEVVHQAKDHLKWADYSLVCLPDETYIPNYHKTIMVKEGIGLLIYKKPDVLIEAIYPAYNRKKDKELRKCIEKRLGSEITALKTVQGDLF